MRYLLGIFLVCVVGGRPALSQETLGAADNVGLNRLMLVVESTPEVDQALEEFRTSETDAERVVTSERLLALAKAAITDGNNQRAIQLTKPVFLSSVPGKSRSQAYSILKQNVGNHYLAPHVREILVRVPNISCYGRFSDWLNATFRDQHAWIHVIEIRNTDRVGDYAPSNGLVIGTEAELKFIVDRSKNINDLAKLLRAHKEIEWVLLVEQRLQEYAEPWESSTDDIAP